MFNQYPDGMLINAEPNWESECHRLEERNKQLQSENEALREAIIKIAHALPRPR